MNAPALRGRRNLVVVEIDLEVGERRVRAPYELEQRPEARHPRAGVARSDVLTIEGAQP